MEARLLDFPGMTGGIVWDVGGYSGDWAAEFKEKTGLQPRCFEPVGEFADKIEKRGIQVERFGLLDKDCQQTIQIATDRSGLYGIVGKPQVAEFRDVVSVLGDSVVAVMKLNVEGAEYPILERLLEAGRTAQIGTLLIQFHGFMPKADKRYRVIAEGLRKTHNLTWRTPWVWERWDGKA